MTRRITLVISTLLLLTTAQTLKAQIPLNAQTAGTAAPSPDAPSPLQSANAETVQQDVTSEQFDALREDFEFDDSDYEFDEFDFDDEFFDEEGDEDDQNRRRKLSRSQRRIFGHNIFRRSNLSFEPSFNIATPPNYKLGPGDGVVINVWGANQTTVSKIISTDGSIFVSGIGPLYLSGMTVTEADNYIQREFSRIFSGIEDEGSYVKLTLGRIRTIQINVMGEAKVPGTYSVSAFASAFHSLYLAGGVNKIGSIRDIRVVRDNKVISRIDIYDYILKGNSSDFIRLAEGDVVVVPPYERLVQIRGRVKRPMIYEIKSDETLSTLIDFAGGFTGSAYTSNVTVFRYNGWAREIYTVPADQFETFDLRDGDVVRVGNVLDTYDNMVSVYGAVFRPGDYELNEGTSTVRELIDLAGGLRGDEFGNRAILTRVRPDMSYETIPLDITAIYGSGNYDFHLRPSDRIYIASIHDLNERKTVSIAGSVASEGTYPFSYNTTLEDLIIMAGGLLESASEMRIDIARRTKDPKSVDEPNSISKVYTFALKDGLVLDGDAGFLLEPFDQVFVRKSPGYQIQRNVYATGEVLYEGRFTLTKKAERLSELVMTAGGLTTAAYPEGARLVRTMNSEEMAIRDAAIRMSRRGTGSDSISISTLDLANTYTVGIELNKALRYPYSDYDVVLREGDRLIVPEYVNTVKINGEVLHSNTVLYRQNEKLRYYINQAGGFTNKAKKRKVYVVHMNGTVSRYKKKKDIQPGSEIIVPSKPDRNRMSVGEIMSIGTTAASLATMGATVSNIVK